LSKNFNFFTDAPLTRANTNKQKKRGVNNCPPGFYVINPPPTSIKNQTQEKSKKKSLGVSPVRGDPDGPARPGEKINKD